jgi:hypothetical protein
VGEGFLIDLSTSSIFLQFFLQFYLSIDQSIDQSIDLSIFASIHSFPPHPPKAQRSQIRFHPTDSNVFVSGSTDGLVNVFNVAGVAECDDHHDLITQTFNSESSVVRTGMHQYPSHLLKSRVGFFGPANEFIYCLTHTETLLLWQLMEVVEGDETSELISRYTSIRESMRGMVRVMWLLLLLLRVAGVPSGLPHRLPVLSSHPTPVSGWRLVPGRPHRHARQSGPAPPALAPSLTSTRTRSSPF